MKNHILFTLCSVGKHINLNTCTCKSSNFIWFQIFLLPSFGLLLLLFSGSIIFFMHYLMRTHTKHTYLIYLIVCFFFFFLILCLCKFFFFLCFSTNFVSLIAYSRYTFFIVPNNNIVPKTLKKKVIIFGPQMRI